MPDEKQDRWTSGAKNDAIRSEMMREWKAEKSKGIKPPKPGQPATEVSEEAQSPTSGDIYERASRAARRHAGEDQVEEGLYYSQEHYEEIAKKAQRIAAEEWEYLVLELKSEYTLTFALAYIEELKRLS